MKTNFVCLIAALLTAFIFQACVPTPDVDVNIKNSQKNDSLETDSVFISASVNKNSINSVKANFINAEIAFPAGRIQVKSTDTNLFNGDFKYTKEDWKPEIMYGESNDTGKLSVKPKSNINNVSYGDSDTCRWFIELNPLKKYDLNLQIGACKGDLNFADFMIQKFKLTMGAGSIKINLKNTSVPEVEIAVGAGKAVLDLTGTWKNNLTANIAGGVGEIEVHLPKDAGVKAEVNGLLGGVEAEGFSKKKNIYTTSSLGKTKYTLDLKIDGAIGKVKLILE